MAIKTAILGYGRSGSTLHADPIEALLDYEMTAVCDIDPEAKKEAQDRFQCRIYDDYKKMVSMESLDLVVIVTRSSQHCRMTCDCLRAGKNVLVTKPWGINAEEAKEMISASRESGQMLLPWLPARWGSDLLRLREIIASGAIGQIFQIRRSEVSFGLRCDWQTEKVFGGGYLLNWGPHLIDQPVQLIGKQIKSVYGELKQIINKGDVEDVFSAIMKTEDNVTIISEYSVGAGIFPNWVIQGDRGTIFVNETDIEIYKANLPEVIDETAYKNPVEINRIKDVVNSTNRITLGNRYGDPFVIYPHIARVIRGEEPYMVSLESALNLSIQLDAVRKSHLTGQVVHL
jgi:scyllo-inositol 2-dehydrogenase (NADP+)